MSPSVYASTLPFSILPVLEYSFSRMFSGGGRVEGLVWVYLVPPLHANIRLSRLRLSRCAGSKYYAGQSSLALTGDENTHHGKQDSAQLLPLRTGVPPSSFRLLICSCLLEVLPAFWRGRCCWRCVFSRFKLFPETSVRVKRLELQCPHNLWFRFPNMRCRESPADMNFQ